MILGEGPYYEPVTHSIRWTDIMGKKIYWVDLNKGPDSLRSVDVEDSVGYDGLYAWDVCWIANDG